MLLKDVTPGITGQIEIIQGNDKRNINVTVSRILGAAVLLEAIRFEGKLVGFSQDSKVSFTTLVDGKVNQWTDIKIAPVKYQGVVYHVIESPMESTTVNRRGAFRVYIGAKMPITTFTGEGPKTHEALIKDISETGFAFISEDPYTMNDLVRLQLSIGNSAELRLTSHVVRMVPKDENSTAFIYGCKFSEKNRLLSNYLMKLQSEKQRQKRAAAYAQNEE